MPRRVVDPVHPPQSILVPAGTTAAAPLVTPCPLPDGQLLSITVLIPPGHVGQTGIRFTLSGQQIVPWSNVPAWLIGDDIERTFPVDVEVDTKLSALCFNVGFFPHTFYLRFAVHQPGAGLLALPAVPLIDKSKLN